MICKVVRLGLISLVLAGCNGRRAGIELRGAQTVEFAFIDCSTGKPVKVSGITVIDDRKILPDESAHAVCDVRPPMGPAAQPSVWTYGIAPPGMIMSPCEELRSGVTYTIATTRPQAYRSFRIRENGTAEALGPACDD